MVLDSIPVLALHGVGMSPELFEPLIAALPGVPCLAPRRFGYGHDRQPRHFDEMVDDVVSMIERHGPLMVVGVSGGATLAVAAALRSPAALRGVVAHEPLLGPLVPALHHVVAASAAVLATSPEPAGAVEFVQRLVGSTTWSALPGSALQFVSDHAAAIGREVPHFVGFAPGEIALSAITTPITVSTGALSPPPRHQAAQVLAHHAGATAAVVAAAGHLVHWENPAGFAAVITDHRRRTLGRHP